MDNWLDSLLSQNKIFTADTLFMYWDGFVATVQLSVISLLVGLLLAVVLAVLRSTRKPILSWPIYLFCYVFRGTPLLIQLYIIYYGITYVDGIQETFWWEWFKNPFYPALLAFTLNTCAYTTEILYGAISETDHRELEAARAYGMSWWTSMHRVVLPGAIRRSLPAYANEVVLLLQSTSIASVITIIDITGAAQNTYSRHYAPFEAFIFAACLYLVITFTILYGFRRLESRLLAYTRPRQ
ncbi:ABC transporter permease [Pseudomaricurvus sp. HS19]|uniref:ABC transporter permease n=1 Tax=Pseudomaricurvus sp. HS19 TaxID=2692626 RepID=UPI00136DFE3B|nr:ABC transporter permease subunit [Pseudomaricurvus sp. HS19]MYM63049.1 ABC transporter permease subunit [Pseudomaricurvus sp. HS19]